MGVKRYSVWDDEMFEEKHALNSTNGMVHLVVKHEDYAALEQQLAAVVAENAGLKSAVVRIFNYGYQHGHESTVEGNYVDIHRNDISEYHEDIVAEIAEEQTPATDAYLAEVRASEAKHVYDSILDNPAVTDMESLVDWLEQYSNDSASFAAQLRQGAAL